MISAKTSIFREPMRSTRKPTGSCAATAAILEMVSAKPSSTKPTPNPAARNGNSGGSTMP